WVHLILIDCVLRHTAKRQREPWPTLSTRHMTELDGSRVAASELKNSGWLQHASRISCGPKISDTAPIMRHYLGPEDGGLLSSRYQRCFGRSQLRSIVFSTIRSPPSSRAGSN